MTVADQQDATCGDLDRVTAQGISRAWGYFAYDSANINATIQQNVASTCFSYGRRYDDGINRTATLTAPWFVSTLWVDGGYCNDPTATCFSLSQTPDRQRYQMPDELAARMRGFDREWSIVQLYRFVEGSNPSGPGTRYECADPDPARHWTGRTEVYRLNDFLAAVDSIGSRTRVTDPATVAEALRRGNPRG